MAVAVLMPKLGNTVEECLLSAWRVSKGDQVAEGDVIADIETDKATFEVEATAGGTVLELFWQEGDLVPVLQNICAVGAPGEDVSAFRPDGPAEAPAATATQAPAAEAGQPASAPVGAPEPQAAPEDAPLSPRARRFLEEHPSALPAVQGSGAGGRIIEADAVKAWNESSRPSPAAAAVGRPSPEIARGAPAEVEVVPLSNVRRIIASRMIESLRVAAQYTLGIRADATGLLALRKRVKARDEALGLGNVNIGDMIMYATVKALERHPEVNALLIDNELLKYRAVHLAVACDTPRGLIVPVMFNAHNMSLREMAETARTYAEQANEGSINPDLLAGGTFTVSSVGSMGITAFTPLINTPQVAVLGVGAAELLPVREGDDVVFKEHVHLSLTADHRAVDGAPAARFLNTLKDIIENFELVCLGGGANPEAE